MIVFEIEKNLTIDKINSGDLSSNCIPINITKIKNDIFRNLLNEIRKELICNEYIKSDLFGNMEIDVDLVYEYYRKLNPHILVTYKKEVNLDDEEKQMLIHSFENLEIVIDVLEDCYVVNQGKSIDVNCDNKDLLNFCIAEAIS